MNLSDGDRHSRLHELLVAHIGGRISKLQKDNDNPKLDLTETSVIRGSIKEARLLLKALTNEPRKAASTENDPYK